MDQQVGCLCQGNYYLSVSLSGFINYLDINNPNKPLRVVKGHNKTITALSVNVNSADNVLYTGSTDGSICFWNTNTGLQDRIEGHGHTNQVADMKMDEKNLYTCGLDDMLKTIDMSENVFRNEVKLDSQPRGVAILNSKNLIIVACYTDVTVFVNGSKKYGLPVDYDPSCININQVNNNDVAIGGTKDCKVHVYGLNDTCLSERITLDHRGAITDVAYSPDGTYLAASDQNR